MGKKKGPPAQPVALVKEKGYHRPSRHGNDIDDSNSLRFVEKPDLPMPPEDLNEQESVYWMQTLGEVVKLSGWVGYIDLPLFKIWCKQAALMDKIDKKCVTEEMIIEDRNGNDKINPIFTMREKAIATFSKLCGQFGFDPSSRTGIKLHQSKQEEVDIYKDKL